jgi:hypothetical protein
MLSLSFLAAGRLASDPIKGNIYHGLRFLPRNCMTIFACGRGAAPDLDPDATKRGRVIEGLSSVFGPERTAFPLPRSHDVAGDGR